MKCSARLLSLLFLTILAGPLFAQGPAGAWCDEDRFDRDQHCELRELTLQPRGGQLAIDVGANGGIRVEGWNGSEVRVVARVITRSRNADGAAELALDVEMLASPGELRVEGPRTRGRDAWSVSVRVQVPHGTRLDLRATNGGITVLETGGGVSARTTNGGIQLAGVAGPITARTTNGSIRASFPGALASSDDIELRTTNGSIQLGLPDGISARIQASTTNGGISADFPITVQGRIGRSLSGVLGDGGAEIRATTTNGAIRLIRN